MRTLLTFCLVLLTFQLVQAQSITVDVHGKQAVYFAGQDPGDLADLAAFLSDPNNSLPGIPESPAFFREHLVRDLGDPEIVPYAIDIGSFGQRIDISAVGNWGHPNPSGPAGRPGRFQITQPSYSVLGVSQLEAQLGTLAGVFLPTDGPSLPAPASLSVSRGDSMRTPELGQAFAIGANLENITIPTTAKQLYLGLHDGTEWINNVGTIQATITARPDLNLNSLQSIFDGFTRAPVPNQSSVDVFLDFLDDQEDSTWTTTGGAISTYRLIAEFGDAEASFGIYDVADPERQAEIFSGPDAAGAAAAVAVNADGSVEVIKFGGSGAEVENVVFAADRFGYYLDSPRNGLFFSDTELNPDGFDHQLAYQGTNEDTIELPGGAPGLWTDNEYVMGWEDLFEGGDRDFNDFVVAVGGVRNEPIPEPASVVCWSLLMFMATTACLIRKAMQ